MTTYTGYVGALADMVVTGVRRRYAWPPAAINSSDLPAQWPQLPSGDEQLLMHGTDNGGDLTLSCQLVVALAPVAQNTQEANFTDTVTMLDNLTIALRALADAAFGPLTWTIQMGSVSVAGHDYWAVLATVKAMA